MHLAVLSIMLKSYLLTTAVCFVTAVLEYLCKDELWDSQFGMVHAIQV